MNEQAYTRHDMRWIPRSRSAEMQLREEESNYRATDEMPALEWEVLRERFLIPPDLQRIIGAPTNIVRVSLDIDRKQRVTAVAHSSARTPPIRPLLVGLLRQETLPLSG